MKRFYLLAIALCCAVFSFAQNTIDKDLGVVEQKYGVFIFTDSKPAAEYITLGRVFFSDKQEGHTSIGTSISMTGQLTTGLVFTSAKYAQYPVIRDNLIGLAIAKNDSIEAVIIELGNAGEGMATLIRFKNPSEPQKYLSRVNMVNGVYVFVDAKPLNAVESVGKYSCFAEEMNYQRLRDKLIKHCCNRHKKTECVVVNMIDQDHNKIEGFKYK